MLKLQLLRKAKAPGELLTKFKLRAQHLAAMGIYVLTFDERIGRTDARLGLRRQSPLRHLGNLPQKALEAAPLNSERRCR